MAKLFCGFKDGKIIWIEGTWKEIVELFKKINKKVVYRRGYGNEKSKENKD